MIIRTGLSIRLVSLSFVFAVLLLSVFVSLANAQTFNVLTTADLRTALEDAAANNEDDIIILAKGTYRTTDATAGWPTGTFRFVGNKAYNLTIQAAAGLTADDVRLDGANINGVKTHQVFNYANTVVSTLTLDRISIINGTMTGSGAGVALNNSNNLIVTGSIISDNDASTTPNSYGGGIYGAGAVTVTNSIISGNTAAVYGGGGIYGGGAVTVTGSTISDNFGGGIRAIGAVTVTNSTFSGNTADSGGGIRTLGAVTVANSTISGNTVFFNGGGVYGLGAVTIANSTISGNTASSSGGGIYGGGIFVNNIFSNNSSDIYFSGDSYVYNNYIDYATKLQNEFGAYYVQKNANKLPIAGSANFIDVSFRIYKYSVAIDAGLDPGLPEFAALFTDLNTLQTVRDALVTDKDGNARIVGGVIDLGAYEYSNNNLYIDPVSINGGSGTVISHPAAIDCGLNSTDTDCFAYFPSSPIVSLETIPAIGGSIFSGWSGDADCGDGQVIVNQPVSCTASFTRCTSMASMGVFGVYDSIGNALFWAHGLPSYVINIIASNQQEILNFAGGTTITLDGGYDCAFHEPPLLMTTITGTVTVTSGTVIFNNIIIR